LTILGDSVRIPTNDELVKQMLQLYPHGRTPGDA